MPLERDEGEYAYAAQVWLDGGLPYRDVYTMKWPGTFVAYAAIFQVFGQSPAAIRLGLLFVNLATAAGVFVLAREFLRPGFACFATACFLIQTLSVRGHGIMANTEHFALIGIVWGLCALAQGLRNLRPGMLLLSGVLLGCGMLVKQHAIMFVALGAALCAAQAWTSDAPHRRRAWFALLWYGAGAGLVVAALLIVIRGSGAWPQFWYWTVVYARSYASRFTIKDAPLSFLINFLLDPFMATAPTYLLALWGLGGICRSGSWKERSWLGGLAIASFLAVCPGYYFRQHYFLFWGPAVALLGASALQGFWNQPTATARWQRRFLTGATGALCLLFPLTFEAPGLFVLTPERLSRQMYGVNPFVESAQVAEYLSRHMSPTGRVAIFGSEPQIAFLAHRRLASGYIYMYPLTEEQPDARQMQQMMMDEVRQSDPEYALTVSIITSWMFTRDSVRLINHLMDRFLADYERCGYVVIPEVGQPMYVFDGPAVEYPPPNAAVTIYRKRGLAPAQTPGPQVPDEK